jgi:threonine aldolase
MFYDWHKPAGFAAAIAEDEGLYRFVVSFANTADEIDRFGEHLAG